MNLANSLLLTLAMLTLLNWWLTRALRHGDRHERRPAKWTALGFAVTGATSALSLPGGAALDGTPLSAQALSLGALVGLGGLDLVLAGLASVRATLALPAEAPLRRAARAEAKRDYPDAASGYLEAVPPLRRGGQTQRELSARLAAGRALLESGTAEAAAGCLKAAAARADQASDRPMLTAARLALGDCEVELNRLPEARAAYVAAAAAAQAGRDRDGMGWALNRLAWVEYVDGDAPLAREYLRWAAAANPEGDQERLLASGVLLAGCLAIGDGHLEVARPALEDAIRFSEAARDREGGALARLALGCAHYLDGFVESGRSYIEQQAGAAFGTVNRRFAGAWLLALSESTADSAPGDSGVFRSLAEELLSGHPWLARPDRMAGLFRHPAAGVAG